MGEQRVHRGSSYADREKHDHEQRCREQNASSVSSQRLVHAVDFSVSDNPAPVLGWGFVNSNWTIPNVLTVARIGLAGVGARLAFTPDTRALAVVILIVAALLDAFDGWYARKFAKLTRLGKHLDPFADKVLVAVILLWIAIDQSSAIIWFLVGLSLAREAAMTLLRAYSARRRLRLIPASALGRWKMFLQSSGGLTILALTHILNRPVSTPWVVAALAVMLVVSVAAMVGYLKAKGSAADHEQTHFALRSPG